MTSTAPQTLPIDEALRQGVAHHQAGGFAEAEQLYRAILEARPDHPDANHNLGILAGQVGQPAAGLPYLKVALTSHPDNRQYLLSYAEALLATGQAKDALSLLQNAMQRGLDTFVAQALRQKAEDALRGRSAIDPLPQAECNQLAALFNAGRLAEVESRARLLVEQYPDSGFVWKVLGASLQEQGKYALPEMQRASELLPNDAEVHNNSGLTLKALGQLDDAMTCHRRALEINPNFAEAHYNLGNILNDLGRFEEAMTNYRRALVLKPDYAEVHGKLGVVLGRLGQFQDAVTSLSRAGEMFPADAEAHCNQGAALKDLGQLDEALISYRLALDLNPDFVEAHYNLGNTLKALGQLDEAVASYHRALEIKPDFVEAHFNLGNTLADLGQLDDAAASHRRALEIKPDYAEVHVNLGNLLGRTGRIDEAMASYRRALAINPNIIEAFINLGNVLRNRGQFDDAFKCYHRALEINPDCADAHSHLGVAQKDYGQLDAALVSFRRSLEIKSDCVDVHSNLIFCLDLSSGIKTAELQQERHRWGAVHAAPLTAGCRPHANRPDPERRLRIGYVSADFKLHSAAIGFGAMLTRFDPARFDIYAYANSTTEDDQTRLFQQSVTHWRKIAGLTDAAVAELVRQDNIDILVDLSGHSYGNRLLVFARKPAPIQISAWGYAGGTGVKAMDVLFSDPVIVPPEEKDLYAEEVRYLPCVISAFFPSTFPVVTPLPAATANGVCFGSFNRLVKLSTETFNTWAQILLAFPASRMLLKTSELDDAATRDRITAQFVQAGVDPSRITLLGKTAWQDHVATFNQIDISLDPFPQSGGITTLEGLMMGVPVVTLRGSTFVGRGSASILTTAGLTDWIAETPEQYVEIAIQKARDLPLLATLRQQLRGRFTSSIIGDSPAYVKAVEQEYRQLWREWCERHA